MSSKQQYEQETGETYTDDYIGRQKYKAWSYNKHEGDLNTLKCEFLKIEEKLEPSDIRFFNCPTCRNKGHVLVIDETGTEIYKTCDCHKIRYALRRLHKSGLGDMASKYNLASYKATEEWQQYIKGRAEQYLQDNERAWFFIGGQVGCGKTFICTAITLELIKSGNNAQYMLWVDHAKKLKQNAMNVETYQKMIDELKEVPVLYIDDFLKTESINTPPTAADFNIAYEILNYRYNKKGLVTIISSEYSVEQIADMSEAIGSRIYEKTEGYNIYIKADRKKNMRYKTSTVL